MTTPPPTVEDLEAALARERRRADIAEAERDVARGAAERLRRERSETIAASDLDPLYAYLRSHDAGAFAATVRRLAQHLAAAPLTRGLAPAADVTEMAAALAEVPGAGPAASRLLLRVAGETEELQRTFDLRWRADMRAIKRWQKDRPDRELAWPDHADLVVWLLERLDKLHAAVVPYVVHNGPSGNHEDSPDGCPEADDPPGSPPCAACRMDAALEEALKVWR